MPSALERYSRRWPRAPASTNFVILRAVSPLLLIHMHAHYIALDSRSATLYFVRARSRYVREPRIYQAIRARNARERAYASTRSLARSLASKAANADDLILSCESLSLPLSLPRSLAFPSSLQSIPIVRPGYAGFVLIYRPCMHVGVHRL